MCIACCTSLNKYQINVKHLRTYIHYIGEKTAHKVLAKSYLGYCKKNNADDAYDTGDK